MNFTEIKISNLLHLSLLADFMSLICISLFSWFFLYILLPSHRLDQFHVIKFVGLGLGMAILVF